MPDILYEMVDRNISKDLLKRISHRARNQETPGDVENALKSSDSRHILDDKLWVQVRSANRYNVLCGKVSHYSNNFVSGNTTRRMIGTSGTSAERLLDEVSSGTKNKLPSFAFVL